MVVNQAGKGGAVVSLSVWHVTWKQEVLWCSNRREVKKGEKMTAHMCCRLRKTSDSLTPPSKPVTQSRYTLCWLHWIDVFSVYIVNIWHIVVLSECGPQALSVTVNFISLGGVLLCLMCKTFSPPDITLYETIVCNLKCWNFWGTIFKFKNSHYFFCLASDSGLKLHLVFLFAGTHSS